MQKLILGSSSPWRAMVLHHAGYRITTIPPDIDEKAIRHDDPAQLTTAIAKAKAESLFPYFSKYGVPRGFEDALFVTSDQVVRTDIDGISVIFEKPTSEKEARRMLHWYGRAGFCETVSAVVVTRLATKEQIHGVDIVKVTFDPIPEDCIAAAIERRVVMGSCGALVHEDPDIAPYIRKMYGPKDSVDGMPLFLLERLLAPFRE